MTVFCWLPPERLAMTVRCDGARMDSRPICSRAIAATRRSRTTPPVEAAGGDAATMFSPSDSGRKTPSPRRSAGM